MRDITGDGQHIFFGFACVVLSSSGGSPTNSPSGRRRLVAIRNHLMKYVPKLDSPLIPIPGPVFLIRISSNISWYLNDTLIEAYACRMLHRLLRLLYPAAILKPPKLLLEACVLTLVNYQPYIILLKAGSLIYYTPSKPVPALEASPLPCRNSRCLESPFGWVLRLEENFWYRHLRRLPHEIRAHNSTG